MATLTITIAALLRVQQRAVDDLDLEHARDGASGLPIHLDFVSKLLLNRTLDSAESGAVPSPTAVRDNDLQLAC